MAGSTAGELATSRGPTIRADAPLDTAIEQLALAQATWAPVVDSHRLVGIVTSEELLRRYTSLVSASMRRLDALAGRGVLVEGRPSAASGLVGKTVAHASLAAGHDRPQRAARR